MFIHFILIIDYASLATTNLLGISRVIRSRFNICRGADGRVLSRPGDAIPPADCFTRRSLPPIYIRGTRPPPTADETDTESEQEDRDGIESDQFIQAPPHDSGWAIG